MNEQTAENQENNFIMKIVWTFYIIFFPAIQAAGLVFVKSSIDPLGNISKLNFLKMVSINQKATNSYCELTQGVIS